MANHRRRINLITKVYIGKAFKENLDEVKEEIARFFEQGFFFLQFLFMRRFGWKQNLRRRKSIYLWVLVWRIKGKGLFSFGQPRVFKERLCDMLSEFHTRGRFNLQISSIFMVLISKVPKPVELKNFKAISLVRCVYKLLYKILANRLR